MRVSLVVAIICLAVLSACTMWNQQKGWSGATGGEQLERLWWEDLKAQRYDQIEKHLGATLLATSPEAVRDRAAYLQYLRELQVTDYSLGEFVTQSNGPDLVVSYSAEVKGMWRDRPLGQRLRFLNIWQQTRHGWVLTAHSATPEAAR